MTSPTIEERKRHLRVLRRSLAARRGMVQLGGFVKPVALGRSGIAARKREGDGATPLGTWRAMAVFYRADRVARPVSGLPVRAIRRNDGWCDAPGDRNYNRAVRLPYPASAEAMWRDDHLYDLVVVLDHNSRPRVRGAGSAIFMHCARDGFAPTAGCIAFRAADLRRLLRHMRRGTRVVV
ncbi:MAG: L,D-transpeptidase [Hyphomicrobiaceae bacterium]